MAVFERFCKSAIKLTGQNAAVALRAASDKCAYIVAKSVEEIAQKYQVFVRIVEKNPVLFPPRCSPAHVIQWSNHLGAVCSRA